MPRMIDPVIFLDNNIKFSIHTGGNIQGLYCYLEIIGSPTNLTSSGRRFCNFCTSSSTKNDTKTIQSVISAL